MRKIVPGGADDSYGIEVANLAGVPDGVIKRAKAVLRELEAGGASRPDAQAQKHETPDDGGQISLASMGGSEIAEILRQKDLNTVTPLEALNLLYELKKKL